MFDLKESPIRKNILSLEEGQLSIFEDSSLEEVDEVHRPKVQVRTILEDIENMLRILEENKDKTIKIAVMGEVKAGKSTFINVCVGKEVAYTDILEATAIVSEISYAKEEFARVYNQDGSVAKECTFVELLEWTEEMLDEMEDFTRFSKIEIGVDNELLKNLVLVDTPGLFSITSENHDVTNQYIAQTDYIMWVLDSRNLGSKVVNEYIDKIKLSGKPIIGIINKVDSEEVLHEIKDYIIKEYSNCFEEIFFVSSANAWNMYKSGEGNWARKTGFDTILDCIEDLVEDKEYSTNKTKYYQLQRERELHLMLQALIEARKKYYDNELACFAKINTEMKKVIAEELKHWYSHELYMEEKTNLMNATDERFKVLFEQYSDAEYVKKTIDNKYNEMAGFVYKKWGMLDNVLMMTSSDIIIDFSYDKDCDLNVGEAENGSDTSTEGAKEGMKAGAMVGMAFAGYSAWLGPAAATITFAEALIPWVLPLAIGGAVVGSWIKSGKVASHIESNAKKKQDLIEDLYQEILKAASKEMHTMGQSLYACTEHYYEERCNRYKEKAGLLKFDFTEPAYKNFYTELKNYISKLDDAIAQCNNGEIPLPPSME